MIFVSSIKINNHKLKQDENECLYFGGYQKSKGFRHVVQATNPTRTKKNELINSKMNGNMKQLKNKTATLRVTAIIFLGLVITMTSCDKNGYGDSPSPNPGVEANVVKGAGDSVNLVAFINQFRALLGDPVNNAPGQTTGRREINWDGVPANFSNNSNFPFDFFNNTDPAGPNGRKRGLEYVNNGTGFRVDSSDFSEIDASYADQFEAFTKKKTFASVGNNITELRFKLAGTTTNAFIKGFGVIFSDVDDGNYTYVEFFNENKSLGIYKAPTRNSASGHSFLGVFFPDERITRVKITAGNGILAAGNKDISNGGNKDLVVLDDFFYDEPKVTN
jgi:hypothetical protein